MKKILWVFLSVSALTLVGCQQAVTFDASDFTSPNAQDINVQDVDFDGDGSSEKVLYYKSDDTVGREIKTTNEHLSILSYRNSEWQIVKDDAFANTNQPVNRFYREQKIVDFGNDEKQELFVQWSYERPLGIGTYYVIAFVNGEYKFLDSPRLNELQYLDVTKGETEMYLTAVAVSSNGIEESYTIYCKEDLEGKPMSNRYEKSCRDIKLMVTLENENLKRQ